MSLTYELKLELQSYWHVGDGKESGAYADALVLKNKDELPYVPGKSLRGLLREAFTQAEQTGWFKDTPFPVVARLFGSEERAGLTSQGVLQVSSAGLCAGETAFFRQQASGKAHLYRVLTATAIDEQTGVAKPASLRTMEVVVPLTLLANLNLNDSHPEWPACAETLNANFSTWLQQVLPLITELGAKRHRGLGRVLVSARPVQ